MDNGIGCIGVLISRFYLFINRTMQLNFFSPHNMNTETARAHPSRTPRGRRGCQRAGQEDDRIRKSHSLNKGLEILLSSSLGAIDELVSDGSLIHYTICAIYGSCHLGARRKARLRRGGVVRT